MIRLTALLIVLFLSSVANSQYFWEVKQPGASIGAPIDVEEHNRLNIYFGSTNIIYKSTNGGESFFQTGTQLPNTSFVKNIILNNDNPSEFLVAVENSDNDLCRIYKTTNAGLTWEIKADDWSFSYFGIPITPDPLHPDTVYAMRDSIFLRSPDFGESWDSLTYVDNCTDPCDIEVFPDTSIILIGDNQSGIFRSMDYGETWTQVYNTTAEVPTIAIDNMSPGTAWATLWGGGGGLLKSTDYGANWIPHDFFTGTNMWGIDVHPANSDYIIAGRFFGGVLYITHDGGINWNYASIGSNNYQIYIIDTMNVFAAQSNGLWKLKSDYFIPVELTSFTAELINSNIVLSWNTASEINNYGFDIELSYDGKLYNKIAFVPGAGNSQEQQNYSYTVSSPLPRRVFFRLKQIDLNGSYEYSHTVEVNHSIPEEFFLAQNYPNPFNPSTSIQFYLPEDAFITLKIFNVLGEEIDELINQEYSAGIYDINFTAELLPSGTYFYFLEAAGKDGSVFSGFKKMLLLK